MTTMTRADAVDISPAAQTYLLTLRSMAGAGEPARAAALSRRLGVSAQAVSEMLSRLTQDGLVTVNERHELELTAAGKGGADSIFRRHSLLEWLLTGVIGLGWAESDEEAGRLQSAESAKDGQNVAEVLGKPRTCPHGNPIDAGAVRTRPRGIPRSDVSAGDEVTILRITEEAEEDVELLSYLEQHGLVPGVFARIVDVSAARDSLVLEGPQGQSVMGLRPARLIRVLPGRADPQLFHVLPVPASP